MLAVHRLHQEAPCITRNRADVGRRGGWRTRGEPFRDRLAHGLDGMLAGNAAVRGQDGIGPFGKARPVHQATGSAGHSRAGSISA